MVELKGDSIELETQLQLRNNFLDFDFEDDIVSEFLESIIEFHDLIASLFANLNNIVGCFLYGLYRVKHALASHQIGDVAFRFDSVGFAGLED